MMIDIRIQCENSMIKVTLSDSNPTMAEAYATIARLQGVMQRLVTRIEADTTDQPPRGGA